MRFILIAFLVVAVIAVQPTQAFSLWSLFGFAEGQQPSNDNVAVNLPQDDPSHKEKPHPNVTPTHNETTPANGTEHGQHTTKTATTPTKTTPHATKAHTNETPTAPPTPVPTTVSSNPLIASAQMVISKANEFLKKYNGVDKTKIQSKIAAIKALIETAKVNPSDSDKIEYYTNELKHLLRRHGVDV